MRCCGGAPREPCRGRELSFVRPRRIGAGMGTAASPRGHRASDATGMQPRLEDRGSMVLYLRRKAECGSRALAGYGSPRGCC